MALFDKEKKSPSPQMPPEMPSQGDFSQDSAFDQVMSLRQQGMSNPEIIQALRQQGHSSEDIFDAMNQSTMSQVSAQDYQQQQMNAPQPPSQGMAPPPMGMAPSSYPSPFGGMSSDAERIEELAEAIIDEKWNEIVRSINKIIDWKDRTEAKINKMEQSLDELHKNFDSLHQGVLGKISEYDNNLKDVSTEIKAMEKVFQKVVPTFTENVNELGRIARDLRK